MQKMGVLLKGMVDGVQPQDVLLVHVHGLVLRYIVNSLALLPFLAVLQDELDVEVYHHFGVEVGWRCCARGCSSVG